MSVSVCLYSEFCKFGLLPRDRQRASECRVFSSIRITHSVIVLIGQFMISTRSEKKVRKKNIYTHIMEYGISYLMYLIVKLQKKKRFFIWFVVIGFGNILTYFFLLVHIPNCKTHMHYHHKNLPIVVIFSIKILVDN